MHSTKNEILALLKRSDGASVEELSTALGFASMTVRQHLTALERDSLVKAQEVRRGAGRPHFRYQLTEDGHRRMSDGYDRLLALLVTEAGRLEPGDLAATSADGRRALLFRRAAASLAERYAHEIATLTPKGQVEKLVAILRAHGGFAEFHERDGAYEVRDFACVYRSNVSANGKCEWHEVLLTGALTGDVRSAPAPEDACAACCRYTVTIRAEAPAMNRGSL